MRQHFPVEMNNTLSDIQGNYKPSIQNYEKN
jgi:hypothetical protein